MSERTEAPVVRSGRRRRLRDRVAEVRRGLGPYARPHRRQLALAVGASVAMVAARLAFPWPLRGIVELTFTNDPNGGGGTGGGGGVADLVPAGDPVLWLVGAVVALGLGLGLAEHVQRLAVARFTVRTVNGARVDGLSRFFGSSSAEDPDRAPGDVLTRVVGDTARVRVGLRGVLVHVLQHGIFVLGVCGVLVVLEPRLGLAYLAGLSVAAVVALAGMRKTATVARKRRGLESRVAARVLRLSAEPGVKAKDKDPDRPRTGAEVTRIKGYTSWAVQGVLGLTACGVLLLAVDLEGSGRLSTGELVLVASYLLLLHHPLARLGRQVTRLGPQVASAERLARLTERSHHRKRRDSATVGVLPRRTELGGGTVAHHIGATSRKARVAAGKAAGVHAYVCELPEGYHTPVGADGVLLSPSQQVRLTLAGLYAEDPPSVVLDDLTAGLDPAGEAAVLPALDALLRGRETVVLSATAAVRRAVEQSGRGGSGTVAHADPPPALAALPRDRALPTLDRLLDPAAMAPILGAAIEPGFVPQVRVRSVRYKPGDNVVVHYDVAGPDRWVEAVAYASADGDLEAKPTQRRKAKLASRAANRVPSAEPLSWLPEVGALLQWLPLDVRIPVLSHTAKTLGRRLAASGMTVTRKDKPKLLRYWARRRAVLRLGDHIIKAYRDPDDFAAAELGLRAAGGLRRVPTAAFEAVLPDLQATVQTWLNGRSPSLPPRRSEPAGAVLAELHAEVLLPVPLTSTSALLDKAAVRAAFVDHLLPERQPGLRALLADLEERRPEDLRPVTSHGNFHAGQLLDTGAGHAVIDVDRLCLAHPGFDLACFASHVAFGREGEEDVVTATLESLLAGYGSRPDDLGWFLAVCLLRRAPVPFRHLDEHWPDAMGNLVDRARWALDER